MYTDTRLLRFCAQLLSGAPYPLILDLVFVPKNSNLFSKLILCHRFSRNNFIASVFRCFCFVCWLLLLLEDQVGWIHMCALQVLLLLLIFLCEPVPYSKCNNFAVHYVHNCFVNQCLTHKLYPFWPKFRAK